MNARGSIPMRAVGLIFARGGSKGLPGKNIRPFAGRPLIAWAITQARAVDRIGRVIVSTDSEEIASAALEHGAEVPFMRPYELARDDSPEWLSWKHAIEFIRKDEGEYPDAIVSVPATAPLRKPADIERCLDEFEKGLADVVITVTDARPNPYFTAVKQLEDRSVQLAFAPPGRFFRRQDAPPVFEITPVAYVAKPAFVLEHDGIFDGVVRCVHVPAERALDIDTALDFKIAESLIETSETMR